MFFYESDIYHADFPYYLYINERHHNRPPHNQNFYEIFLTYSESVIWHYGSEKRVLPFGTLVFVCPGQPHFLRESFGCGFNYVNLSFTDTEYLRILDFLELRMYRNEIESENKAYTLSYEQTMELVKKIKNIEETDFSSYRKKISYCRLLLAEILSDYLCNDNMYKNTPSWLNSLCIWLKKDMNFSNSLDEICEHCGKSKENLCRSMKKYLGLTPTKYINMLRLEYVASMLETSDMLISELYLKAGFFSGAYFNKLFKEKYGIGANEYRKINKLNFEMQNNI